ncbi:uncharacterized protein LOC141591856 isoform X1 [Silene latifolia]|uniref:uncharacterized protein LOC141591856 isoform X1 n=1 Tax=Silene latifolia TaxID=37657 RepID=UPI003D77542C
MDSQTIIFDVSSDEEFGFDNSSTNEDLDWIAKLLEDVADGPDPNREEVEVKNVEINKVNNNVNVVDDDDDDVVIVGEVIVKPKGAKRSFSMMNNGGRDDDDDDDCVVLECDPDKPPPSKGGDDEVKKYDDDDDSDEVVVVGEKGQVACRDFPHSRHLCANFPFSSTSHESRCELCHCYVCDSLAPCAHWGSGASTTDHCHATDKAVYWQTERKKFRQSKNPSAPISKPTVSLGPFQYLQPSARPLNPRVASACSGPLPFGVPNTVSQGRTQRPYVAVARDGYQRHLVSQQLLRVRNSDTQGNRVAQLAPRTTASLPILKRNGLTARSGVSNRAPLIWQDSNNSAVKFVDNASANLQGSSQFVRNPVFRQSNTTTLTSQLPGYVLPNPHTSTSPFTSCGLPAALYEYTNASMRQAQSISSPLIACSTSNALKGTFQSSQQHPVEAQNASLSDYLVPTSDMPPNIPQKSNQSLGILQCPTSIPFSTLNELNPPNSMEMGPHDFLLNVEKDSQTGLDFDIERWLVDETVAEGFDMSGIPPQTSPIDTGMLYFDFETSWQGLAQS